MKCNHRLKTVFHGLADMPAEFQKATKIFLIELKNKFCFLDDDLIVKDLTKNKYSKFDCLKPLDRNILRIYLPESFFLKLNLNVWVIIFHKLVSHTRKQNLGDNDSRAVRNRKKTPSFLG